MLKKNPQECIGQFSNYFLTAEVDKAVVMNNLNMISMAKVIVIYSAEDVNLPDLIQ